MEGIHRALENALHGVRLQASTCTGLQSPPFGEYAFVHTERTKY